VREVIRSLPFNSKNMDNRFTLHIKNMVCPRCISLLQKEFIQLGVDVATIELGKIQLMQELTPDTKQKVEDRLLQLGFELMVDQRIIVVEQVKTTIIEYVQEESRLTLNLSDYLATKLNLNYVFLAKLFVENTQLTVEKFYILQRIERVKELISYDELSLDEIAKKLHYNDLSHMSKQFKKMVGIAPSIYRKNQLYERKFLDHIIT